MPAGLRLTACILPLLCCLAWSADAPKLPSDDFLRLLGTFKQEPLIAIFVDDARTLPQRFNRTHLGRMLADPNYSKGAETLSTLVGDSIGANITQLWPDVGKLLSGPAVLAMLPGDEGGAFRLVLAVLTPDAQSTENLLTLWPKVPPQAKNLLAMLKLQPVDKAALPALEVLPPWASAAHWPAGDMGLRMLPRKLGSALRVWLETNDASKLPDFESWMPVVSEIDGSELDYIGLGVCIDGELFTDSLRIDVAPSDPGDETSFTRIVKTIKEDPNPWTNVLAAIPGEQDVVVLAQADLKALGKDAVFGAQALERHLRGKRWARSKGKQDDALELSRYNFLLQQLQGSVAIVGRPALSGDLRLTIATALKTPDAETFRADLITGLTQMDAVFETLKNVGKIGGSAPLGATFQGRGLFGAPVLGLSPGWLWLCSNSAAYQDLTSAFKNGKTMHAEQMAAARNKQADLLPMPDSLRVQIDLEKVVKIAYAAWLLSGDEGPFIGAWKVPASLLPQPQVLTNRLGTLRASLARVGNSLHAASSATVPATALLLPALLQSMALSIDESRAFSQSVLSPETAPETPNSEKDASKPQK